MKKEADNMVFTLAMLASKVGIIAQMMMNGYEITEKIDNGINSITQRPSQTIIFKKGENSIQLEFSD